MYWNGDMSAAGWFFMILGTLLMLALLAGAAVWIAGSLKVHDRAGVGAVLERSPREILDRRLAAGELTVEQYDELRAAVDGQRAFAGRVAEPQRPEAS
jgi:uncharacterized membrane protein